MASFVSHHPTSSSKSGNVEKEKKVGEWDGKRGEKDRRRGLQMVCFDERPLKIIGWWGRPEKDGVSSTSADGQQCIKEVWSNVKRSEFTNWATREETRAVADL